MNTRKALIVLMAFSLAAFAFGEGKKDSVAAYPTKEIRIIVAYGPGGQTDLISRNLAEVIQKKGLISKTILTVNMSGGATSEALNAVKNAPPDGYTFLLHHTAILTSNVMGSLTLTHNDYDIIGGIVEQPFGLVARKDDARWKDMGDFIKDAKANPGKYSVGVTGYASPSHFALLQFLSANDALGTVKEIPYNGGAATIAAHLGGHIDLRATNMGDSARYVKSGEIKFLGMLSSQRNQDYPDIIAMNDLGLKHEGLILRTGFFAPKGTPAAIKQKFFDIISKAVADPSFKVFSDNMCNKIVITDGDAFKKIYDEDLAGLKALAKDLKK